MRQARVAREARIGKSQLSKYETGKDLPKLESLERVLDVLRVGYFEFFYTLHLVDRGGGSPYITPRAAFESIEAAFERIMPHLLDLYRQVITVTSPQYKSEEEVVDGESTRTNEKP